MREEYAVERMSPQRGERETRVAAGARTEAERGRRQQARGGANLKREERRGEREGGGRISNYYNYIFQ